MALVTTPLMWLAPGATVATVTDTVTGLVTGLVVDNPTAKPLAIRLDVAARSVSVTVPAGQRSVTVPAPGALPAAGENVSFGGVI